MNQNITKWEVIKYLYWAEPRAAAGTARVDHELLCELVDVDGDEAVARIAVLRFAHRCELGIGTPCQLFVDRNY